jgi:hypothetical protein
MTETGADTAGGKIRRCAVSAYFQDASEVDLAVARLTAAGVPRDRVDVAVTPGGAKRLYGGRGRGLGREMFRYAGIGGITGLVIGAVIAIVLVALPGFQEPGVMAWVQLVGPNFATVTGAVLGAAFGWLRRRSASPWHARLARRPESILIAAVTRSREEAGLLEGLLRECGGTDAQVELF